MNLDQSLTLPQDSYFAEAAPAKDLIVLHHTVGGSARSTFDYWRTDDTHIGTCYIVERDGTIFQTFPPTCWAYHLGVKGDRQLDRRSIGIEIASEGPLLSRDSKFYAFGRMAEQTLFTGAVYDHGTDWRGYRYFAQYTPAAMGAVIELVDHLLSVYSIPRQTSADHLTADAAGFHDFCGVLAHSQLRADKTDVHPGFAWQRLIAECGLSLTDQQARSASKH